MKKIIIPILVMLIGLLGLNVHDQHKQRETQEFHQVIGGANASSGEMEDSKGVISVKKMNSNRRL